MHKQLPSEVINALACFHCFKLKNIYGLRTTRRVKNLTSTNLRTLLTTKKVVKQKSCENGEGEIWAYLDAKRRFWNGVPGKEHVDRV